MHARLKHGRRHSWHGNHRCHTNLSVVTSSQAQCSALTKAHVMKCSPSSRPRSTSQAAEAAYERVDLGDTNSKCYSRVLLHLHLLLPRGARAHSIALTNPAAKAAAAARCPPLELSSSLSSAATPRRCRRPAPGYGLQLLPLLSLSPLSRGLFPAYVWSRRETALPLPC